MTKRLRTSSDQAACWAAAARKESGWTLREVEDKYLAMNPTLVRLPEVKQLTTAVAKRRRQEEAASGSFSTVMSSHTAESSYSSKEYAYDRRSRIAVLPYRPPVVAIHPPPKTAPALQTTQMYEAKLVTAVVQPCWDDEDGHYILRPNASLTPRYKIMRCLGQGTFGTVAECWDRVLEKYCAIKIIRAIKKYRDASKTEIRILRELERNDPYSL